MISTNPTISVIIPCYNRENLIGDAIKSALSQQCVHEVIVVDDGSTDDSWKTISKFGSKIKAIQTPNGGPSLARNAGVAVSSGEWIKFLDSDDLLFADAILMQVEQIATLPARSIPVGQLLSDDIPPKVINKVGTEISAFNLGREAIQVSRPLIPRSAFDDVGGFRPSTISEDYELFVRMAASDWRFFEFDTTVTQFRDVDPQRLTSNLDAARFLELLSVFQRIETDLFEGSSTVSAELRRGVGVSAWSMARRCTRLGHVAIGSKLFELATRIGGRSSQNGSTSMLILYRILDPVRVEKITLLVKKMIR